MNYHEQTKPNIVILSEPVFSSKTQKRQLLLPGCTESTQMQTFMTIISWLWQPQKTNNTENQQLKINRVGTCYKKVCRSIVCNWRRSTISVLDHQNKYTVCITFYYAQQGICWKPGKMSKFRSIQSTIQIWTDFHENEAKIMPDFSKSSFFKIVNSRKNFGKISQIGPYPVSICTRMLKYRV